MALQQVAILRAALEQGTVGRERLEARLGSSAIGLLDAKLEPMRWYPADAVAELIEANWELCLGRNADLAVSAGHTLFRELKESGRYQQLEYAAGDHDLSVGVEALRHTRLVGSVVLNLFNFLELGYELVSENPTEICITYDRAELYPELARYVGQGFVQKSAEEMGASLECSSKRVRPDRVQYRLMIEPTG
ncbi:MAG: hypothetical protein GY723_22445 [bacterium]|nr:hypothetical protein [bacterium]